MTISLTGRSSWIFHPAPSIIATGTVAGPREGQGPLGSDFDVIHTDPYIHQKSYEAAEQRLLEEACNLAIRHAHAIHPAIGRDTINLHFSGDLQNQIISSNFTARELAIPYLGLFGACSTAVQALALAALATSSGAANLALASTVSHTNAVEKQFRYPNEYGAQKNSTTQITVTGAGAAVVAAASFNSLNSFNVLSRGHATAGAALPPPRDVRLTSATIGRVQDFSVTDPFNMGAAMAPAACDTLLTHLADWGISPDYYDLILTGDLGRTGSLLLTALLDKAGVFIPHARLADGGALIFPNEEANLSGGSGCGCMAIVALGHIWRRMLRGELSRVLLIATGALLSPLSGQQKNSIPGIAHAISLEVS